MPLTNSDLGLISACLGVGLANERQRVQLVSMQITEVIPTHVRSLGHQAARTDLITAGLAESNIPPAGFMIYHVPAGLAG